LEWQLRGIQVYADDKKTKRNFGIWYHGLGKNDSQQQPFPGLVVFAWEASDDLCKNVAERCVEQIIPVVQEKRLPFILCLKKKVDDAKGDVGRGMALLNETMKKLRADLKETHLIIRTQTPSGASHCLTIMKH